MADFQFKTRGQQNPQGKQKVYFTCHPQDFEMYFETIAGEILDRQNCAVFFLEPNITPKEVEDYELKLGEMQLFVVPVTTRLLTKESRAMDREVPFAFERHIPVLPLMQERELDELFNRKFGDLQYLDKNNTDPTAIPYEEKLTKYLESVIIGDEMVKQIKEAFDAYIFLSYRKKDRKYALELMRLIHSNDFCRDIAIWYDEFLTPGENFNDAIREALEKSGLFALTVTPNLVNELNYILTVEYPMAKKMKKPVLPTEMIPTDKEKLNQMYEDMPKVVSGENTEELTQRLLDEVKQLAIAENDKDPKHNFFIGLAYLNGIDVEVNYKQALILIENAASNGIEEAYKKLVEIYYKGQGVSYDIIKALDWQHKLVNFFYKKCEENPSCEYLRKLINSLMILSDINKELCDYKNAILHAVHTVEICEYLVQKFNTLSNISLYSETLNRAMLSFLENTDYINAVKYAEKLIINDSLLECNEVIALHYSNSATVFRLNGNYQKAKSLLFKAIDIYEHMNSNSIYTRYYQADSYNQLALFYRDIGNYVEGYSMAKKALEISKLINLETKNQYETEFIFSLINLAELLIFQKELDKSIPYLKTALNKINKLTQKNLKLFHLVSYTARILTLYGHIFFEKKIYSKAERYYNIALEIYLNHTDTSNYLYQRWIINNNLGALYMKLKKYQKAYINMAISKNIAQRICKNEQSYIIALADKNLAASLMKLRRYSEALPLTETALDKFVILYQNYSNNLYRLRCKETVEQLFGILLKTGHFFKACSVLLKYESYF